MTRKEVRPVSRLDLERLLSDWVTYETLTLPEVADRLWSLMYGETGSDLE